MGSRYVIFRMWSLCEELGISGFKEPIASAEGEGRPLGRPGQSTCMEQLLDTGELLGKRESTTEMLSTEMLELLDEQLPTRVVLLDEQLHTRVVERLSSRDPAEGWSS
jgi:hypothetical protein